MYLDITIDEIDEDLLYTFINKDRDSDGKQFMHEADRYYNVENTTISNRRKMMMLLDKKDNPYIKEDLSKANNKLKHSYLQEIINQCTNYLAGKPMKIDYKISFDEKYGEEQSREYKDLIDEILYKKNDFITFIQENIKNVQLYGKSYMRIVRDKDINKFVTYDPKEIIMFYNDFDKPILCIRYFTSSEIVTDEKGNKNIQEVKYAEVYDDKYKDTWRMGEKGLVKLNRENIYGKELAWKSDENKEFKTEIEILDTGVFPIIEWKFNSEEIPTLMNIKDFIDLQDINLSDLANNVEDIQDVIWILENYNGQNLSDFMRDLKEKKAIKVGAGGSVDHKTVEIPIEARTRLYDLCSKNIYKFGFAIDFTERDSLGNVSGVALKWSYAPLEQKSNAIEIHGIKALDNFFNILFNLLNLEYDSNDLEFIFDRTMIINEQEVTSTTMSVSSIISKKSVLDNLPMIKDTEDELSRLEEEDEYEPISTGDDEIGEEDQEENSVETLEDVDIIVDNPSKE